MRNGTCELYDQTLDLFAKRAEGVDAIAKEKVTDEIKKTKQLLASVENMEGWKEYNEALDTVESSLDYIQRLIKHNLKTNE